MAGQGLNTTLTAMGYGTYQLRTMRVRFGLNIIANEDQSATFKYLYTRQVQTDTFSIDVLFDTTRERDAFFGWYQGYADQAIIPSPVGSMRCQIPSRSFDMTGTLTDGPEKTTTPRDVTWTNTLNFKGAYMTNQFSSAASSTFKAPANDVANQFFYPNSTDLGHVGPSTVDQYLAALAAANQGIAVQNAINARINHSIGMDQ